MSGDPELETVRAVALALPGAEERLSHGTPGFRVAGGKFFAYFRRNHHGDGETALVVRTSGRDEQETLLAIDPDLYFLPAYLAHAGWISIRLDRADRARIVDRISASWRLAAPARLLQNR